MTVEDLKKVLKKANEREITIPQRQVWPSTIQKTPYPSFHINFPSMPKKIWTTYDSYIDNLHKTIKEDLDINIETLYCESSKALQKYTPAFRYDDLAE